ncbi:MAG: signal peptide peptidase SppA [Leptospirales bacterium]
MIRLKRFSRYAGIFLVVTILIYLFGKGASHFGRSFPIVGGAQIGLVRINGVIMRSEKTIDQIRSLASDPDIKAIILRINSPGGAVVPSQDIWEEVLKARKKGKIVVASIGTVGASGAYYIASASDYIMASSGSLTGSIGVIMELAEVKDLLDKLGIHSEVVKSGAMKDVGSPFRPMTPEERTYMESLLENIHKQFILSVAEGRHLPPSKIKPLADGRVFTGQMALENHLVDATGDYHDALRQAAKMAHLKGVPSVRSFSRKTFWDSLLSSKMSSFLSQSFGSTAGFWSVLPGAKL